MRRLIIGCGYLGRRVAAAWVDAGDTVHALTRTETHAQQLADIGVQPILGDVTHPQSLQNLPECDTVLHAVGFDRKAEPSKREVYVDGLQHVLDRMSSRCDRFLHVSSTSVYGQQNGEDVDENSPCEPEHESGLICVDAERAVLQQLQESAGTDGAVLRLGGIYGADRLLSRINAIRSGLSLPGPADAWLNLIHVDDAVRAVVAAAATARLQPVYLVSDDRPVRRRDYYARLASLLDAAAPEFDDAAVARHTRGLGKRCNNTRLTSELGVQLQYPTIDAGLPHAISQTTFDQGGPLGGSGH